MLVLLLGQPRSVHNAVEQFGVSQTGPSQLLRVLRDARKARVRREAQR